MTMAQIRAHGTGRTPAPPQLDLFTWANPPAAKRRRYYGFQTTEVVCVIGPHWWFDPSLYLSDPDGGQIPVPSLLRRPINFRNYQFRGPDDDRGPRHFWVHRFEGFAA